MFYIYVIQNKFNNKLYVGKTNNLKRRWQEHKKIALNGGRDFHAIHAALKKYGTDIFSFSMIEQFENELDALEAEMFWIEYFESHRKNIGYNETMGGDGAQSGIKNPMYGKKHSDTTKLKMSQKQTGELNQNYGKHHSSQTKQIMSDKKIHTYLGENNPHAQLTNVQASEIRAKFATGSYSNKTLRIEYNVSRKVIREILQGKTYNGDK